MIDIWNETVSSSIHKLNYTYKILSILLMFMCIIIADSELDMFIINFFIFIIMLNSNIRFRTYIRDISVFGVFIFLVFFVVSLIYLDLYIGMFWCVKVIDIILYLSIVSITSTYYHLAVGIRSILLPLRYFMDIDKVSLDIAYGIKFISVLYDERDRSHRSRFLRGVKFSEMGFVDKIDCLFNEIGPVVRLTRISLDKQRSNICVKKYGISFNRYNYMLNKWGKTDTILLVINALVMFITFVY